MSEISNQSNARIEPDWVDEALKRALSTAINDHERKLATKLVEQAFQNSTISGTSVGLSLAAAFDLFTTIEYYRGVTNQGWLYCPSDEPLLLYPFTNTCPRCVLRSQFNYHKSNKPESGSIGATTSRLLCVFLEMLFAKSNRALQIYKGTEPVDMIVYDPVNRVVLLAEVKVAPLTTLPLAVSIDKQTGQGEAGIIELLHTAMDNAFLNGSDLNIYLPMPQESSPFYRLIPLGRRGNVPPASWAYEQIYHLFGEDDRLFADFFHFWHRAYQAYTKKNKPVDPVYWMTNGCGQPAPRPDHWPRRPGSATGYESISDSKTSVGMDRTDDIKKGIYQVLKIGTASKPRSEYNVKTALISNIHAVRHYDEYLLDLQDVVWTLDPKKNSKDITAHTVMTAGDLPIDTPMYNLFDGIISFTENYSRDGWIDDNFKF